jgi:hypothetical protein
MKHPQNIAVVKSAFRSQAPQTNHRTAYPWPRKGRQLSANDVSEQITLTRVLGYTPAQLAPTIVTVAPSLAVTVKIR